MTAKNHTMASKRCVPLLSFGLLAILLMNIAVSACAQTQAEDGVTVSKSAISVLNHYCIGCHGVDPFFFDRKPIYEPIHKMIIWQLGLDAAGDAD